MLYNVDVQRKTTMSNTVIRMTRAEGSLDVLRDVYRQTEAKDLQLHCADGVVQSYQLLFSLNSEFLKGLLNRFQILEWEGDISTEFVRILDRRKGNDSLSIYLPDFCKHEVNQLISLFTGDSIIFSGADEVGILRSLMNCLKISSFSLSSLYGDQGVNISRYQISSWSSRTQMVVMQPISSIKSESEDTDPGIDDGNDTSQSLNTEPKDEIKSSLKNCHKGTEPNLEEGTDDEKSLHERLHSRKKRLKANKSPLALLDDKTEEPESEKDKDTHQPETQTAKVDIERKKDDPKAVADEKTELEVFNQKEPLTVKRKVLRKPCKKRITEVHDDVMTDPDKIIWKNILCIVCKEEIKCFKEKQSENRRKYQNHLLSHFTETLFSSLPFSKDYSCNYSDCSYLCRNRGSFIQHLSFKHSEWFKRINRIIQECESMESVLELVDKDEMERIKLFFSNDLRILPLGKDLKLKSRWVEGTDLGNLGDELNIAEKYTETEKKCASSETLLTNSDIDIDDLLDSPKRPDIDDLLDSPKRPDKTEIRLHHLNQEKSPIQSEKENSDVSRTSSPLVALPSTIVSEEIASTRLCCELCQKELDVVKGDLQKNRYQYFNHLLQHQEIESLFEIPNAKKLVCKADLCSFQTATKLKYCLHLADRHHELLDKLETYIENNSDNIDPSVRATSQVLIEIRETLLYDPRIVDGSYTRPSSAVPSCSIRGESMVSSSVGRSRNKIRSFGLLGQDEGEETETCNASTVTDFTSSDFYPKIVIQSQIEIESAKNVQRFPEQLLEESPDTNTDVDESLHASNKEFSGKIIPRHLEPDACSKDPETATGEKNSTVREYAGFVCKSCSGFYRNRSEIVYHVLINHMNHLFVGVQRKSVNSCTEHNTSYESWEGFVTHNMFHHPEFRAEKDHLEGMIQWFERSKDTFNFVEEEGSQVVQKEIKQEMTVDPVPVDIFDTDSSVTNWTCKVCRSPFSEEDLIRKHVILEHLQDYYKDLVPDTAKIYMCTQCHNHSTTDRRSHILHLAMIHQVVEEDRIYEYITESRALLLDIDVIRCRCGQSFEDQNKLEDHITSAHFKARFKNIPKRLNVYKCTHCKENFERRYHLIQHLVLEHSYISQPEIDKYIPGNGNRSDLSQSDDEMGDDDSAIDFNDSVSQVHIEKVLVDGPGANVRLNLHCPVCMKRILQPSNFEDHLETHGISAEPVFYCSECDCTMAFSQQFYHVLNHHANKETSIRCLSCDVLVVGTGGKDIHSKLKNHATTGQHADNAKLFMENPSKNLFITFRYSCQLCRIFFSRIDLISEHSSEHRIDPVYKCHLCDFSKAASKFSNHCMGIQHRHKIDLVGLRTDDIFYSCRTCNIATDFQTILKHLKDGKGKCELMCGPCDVQWLEAVNPVETLTLHVNTTKHTNCVSEFNKTPRPYNHFNSEYRYKCESCCLVFPSVNRINSHKICQKFNFRCLPCEKTTFRADFQSHIASQQHKLVISSRANSGPPSINVDHASSPSVIDEDSPPRNVNEVSPYGIYEEGSPSEIQILDSPPPQRRLRICDTVDLSRPGSPGESVLELSIDGATSSNLGISRPPSSQTHSSSSRLLSISASTNPEVTSLTEYTPFTKELGSTHTGQKRMRTVQDINRDRNSARKRGLSDLSQETATITRVQVERRHTKVTSQNLPRVINPAPYPTPNLETDPSVVEINIQESVGDRSLPVDEIITIESDNVLRSANVRTAPHLFRTPALLAGPSAPKRPRNTSSAVRTELSVDSQASSSGTDGISLFVCLGTCQKSFFVQNEFKEHLKQHDEHHERACISCRACNWQAQGSDLLNQLSKHILGISHHRNKIKYTASRRKN